MKGALFGSAASEYLWIHFDATTLRCLANGSNASAFDPEELGLYDQANALWKKNNVQAARLFIDLLKEAITPVSKSILEGLIDGISLHDILATSTTLGLPGISTIAERSTRLTTNPEFWRLALPWEWHSEIAEGLCRAGDARVVLSGIVDSGRHDLVLRLLRSMPSVVVPALLGTINTKQVLSDKAVTLAQIADDLRPYTEDVRSWTKQAPALATQTLALISFVLRPEDEVFSHTTVENWICVLQDPAFGYADIHLRSFIFALALGNLSRRGYELAERTFQEVHTAAADQRIGYENWSLIRPFLPELSWYNNWDKCERLRRGLCAAYVEYMWPPSSLLGCVGTEKDFKDLLASCEAVPGGKVLIDKILRTMYEQSLPEFKRRILEKISRR